MKGGGGDDHARMGLLTRMRPLRVLQPGVARLLAMVADEFYDRPQPPGPLWPRDRCGR